MGSRELGGWWAAFLGALVASGAMGCSGGGGGGVGGGGGGGADDTTVGLHDAARDDLAALEVDVVEVSLVPAGGGAAARLFPPAGTASTRVNLLRLQGVTKLLTTLGVPAGTYDQVRLVYSAAAAVDGRGNSLTVSPASGTAAATLAPAFTSPGGRRLLDLDVDVDASVRSLVAGPGGSLTFAPVLTARALGGGATGVEDVRGVVQAVGASSFELLVGGGVFMVSVDASTAFVGSGASSLTTAALAALVPVGATVEVRGTFDVAARSIRASEVALEDGGVAGGGPSLGGVVLSVGAADLEVLVLDPRQAGAAAGAVVRVAVNAATAFAYDGFPAVSASLGSVAAGQEVRVFGLGGPARAVRLRQTKLRGVVTSVDAAARRLLVQAASFEGVAVTRLVGVTNPVVVQLDGALPAGAAAGARVELEGQWRRTAPGVFDVSLAAAVAEEAEVEGVARVVTTSPLSLQVTGDAGLLGNPATITVRLAPGAALVERTRGGVTTPITEADLAAGVAAGRYDVVKATGAADAATRTITAARVRADVR